MKEIEFEVLKPKISATNMATISGQYIALIDALKAEIEVGHRIDEVNHD